MYTLQDTVVRIAFGPEKLNEILFRDTGFWNQEGRLDPHLSLEAFFWDPS